MLNSSGVLFAFAEPYETDDADDDDGKAGELCRFEPPEEYFVIAAQKFEEESCERVEDGIEGDGLTAGVLRRAEEKQDGEDDDIELSFPDFGRPERNGTVCLIGECCRWVQDTERPSCRCAECVSVEEIGIAADGLSQYDGRRDDVGEGERVYLMISRVEPACDDAEYDTALDRHAALPDVRDL